LLTYGIKKTAITSIESNSAETENQFEELQNTKEAPGMIFQERSARLEIKLMIKASIF
jgi:hypothetical protein